MIDILSLSMALSVGQGPGLPQPVYPQPGQRIVQQQTMPSALPTPNYPRQMPSLLTSNSEQPPMTLPNVPMNPMVGGHPAPATPAPAVTTNGNGAAAPCTNCGEEKKEEEAEEPESYFIMNVLNGTSFGQRLEERGITISGWTAMSYTGSQNVRTTNSPVTWNDRANRFLLQQSWLRIEKGIDTEAETATFGYRADILFGTDYRFTLPRGLFNDQLKNSRGQQNLYGVDPIQFYVNAYLPNVGNGVEVRAGRLYTPFGTESLEAISTPLVSRSYAFNWAPPFTHMGVQFSTQLTDRLSALVMIANGNDVFIDPSQELRVVGNFGYKSEDEKTAVTFGYSLGRGKFNNGDPFAPTTVSLMSEDSGRNNINVLDLVITRQVSDNFTYGFEAIYGYQTGVPTTALRAAQGLSLIGSAVQDTKTHTTAHWGSVVNYFTYKFNDKFTGIVRAEAFDDFQGQRTGFEGLYTAITGGLQIRPSNWLLIRPELRYDYNVDSRPFEGNKSLITAAIDAVIRY
jgi:hypothetical protein